MGKRGPAPRRESVQWNPALAYAVGLLTTDGNLSPDGRHIDFTSKDVALIETFKQCLNLTNRITIKFSGLGVMAHHVQFGDVVLYQWLLDIGLMPNKSKIIGALSIPDAFFFDFLRGHLDGDGTIKNFSDPVYPNSERLYVSFCSASRIHLEWLQGRIENLLSIDGFLQDGNRESTLTFAKQDSIRLLRAMYHSSDIPCLKRKYSRAKKFLVSNV